uniref:Reverse transcriptase RNase H-like domain-containing protein n=1 Tax=Amphimedon queenslandica TaxID=400682 RepID=A0A1X7TL15_AMPQE
WLHQFEEKNARLTRWSLTLQPYNFTVQHKKGLANANADVLSRMNPELHFVPK